MTSDSRTAIPNPQVGESAPEQKEVRFRTPRSPGYLPLKRSLDIVAVLALSVIALPIVMLFCLLILLFDRHNPFFSQERVGRNRQAFRIVKLRSMRTEAPNVPSSQLNTAYVTKIGHFMRLTGIDEIPQLWNVLKGDMSLIGFRPGLAAQEDLDELRKARGVYALPPGVTGFSQINTKVKTTLEEKAEMDGYYTEHVGLSLDLQVFFKTFVYVFKKPPQF